MEHVGQRAPPVLVLLWKMYPKEYMVMSATIRLATEQDAAQTLAIYTPLVTNTNRSFELEPPSVNDMQQRIMRTLERMPWLSCEIDGTVAGYAYANPHRVRAAYQWSVEVSVYVDEGQVRKGIGRALYTSLLQLLSLQGFYNAYAGISLPNPPAVALHESMGFQQVGVYRAVAYKLGAWHNVGWWQKELQERPDTPTPPMPLTAVRSKSTEWEAALAAGTALIRS
jgi:phosphinothricin acetyltransferase